MVLLALFVVEAAPVFKALVHRMLYNLQLLRQLI